MALIALAGCISTSPADPLTVALDRQASPSRRAAALDAALAADAPVDPAAVTAALHALAWEPMQPWRLRAAALERLAADDPEAFAQQVRRRLPRLDHEPVRRLLLAWIADHRRLDLLPVTIASYARPDAAVPDDRRPEAAVLAVLAPGRSVVEAALDVLAGRAAGADISHRVAAWELLGRLESARDLSTRLMALPGDSALVADLQAGWRDLGILPTGREGVLWLMHLREPANGAWWNVVRDRLAQLSPSQRRDLGLRHLPLLARAGESQLSMSRQRLLARLESLLAGAEHHPHRPQPVDIDCMGPQDLASWAESLGWGDLLLACTLAEALAEAALVAELFAQADADHADAGSEHGGALVFADEHSGLVPRAFEPLLRRHDRRFYAPPDLYWSLYEGLAHYHFHAQEHRNATYAGPGRGDLALAARSGAACVVLTFISRDELNVDLYLPTGAILDLGTLRR